MLHLLPTELLLLVIEFTLPPDGAYTRYKERQDALRNYCIVSRTMREVAQPVLQRVFRPTKTIGKLLISQPELAKNVRIFQAKAPVPSFNSVVATLAEMPKLKEVRLEDYTTKIGRKQQESFVGVHSLILNKVKLAGDPPTFANLTSLCLHFVNRPGYRGGVYLPPFAFPGLRALYTTSYWYDKRRDVTKLVTLPELHPQLEVLQILLEDYEQYPNDFSAFPSTTLFIMSLQNISLLLNRQNDPRLPRPRHLHLSTAKPRLLAHEISRLQFMSTAVSRQGQLQTLSLPARLHPSFPSPLEPELVLPRDELLTTCALRSIKVIWRSDPDEDEVELGVDKEFWAYAKELRRKKEDEAADASEAA